MNTSGFSGIVRARTVMERLLKYLFNWHVWNPSPTVFKGVWWELKINRASGPKGEWRNGKNTRKMYILSWKLTSKGWLVWGGERWMSLCPAADFEEIVDRFEWFIHTWTQWTIWISLGHSCLVVSPFIVASQWPASLMMPPGKPTLPKWRLMQGYDGGFPS